MDHNDGNSIGPVGHELLGRLLNERAAALELYARQFCDCPEDIVQESFVDLVRQAVLPTDTVAWLYRVVRNKAISASRARNCRKKHERDAATGRQNWFSTTPGDVIDAEKAKAVLAHLDRDEREIVVAKIWGELTFQQIAALIGATDSTAFRRYESALQKIRQKLRVPCPKTTN